MDIPYNPIQKKTLLHSRTIHLLRAITAILSSYFSVQYTIGTFFSCVIGITQKKPFERDGYLYESRWEIDLTHGLNSQITAFGMEMCARETYYTSYGPTLRREREIL